MGISQSGRPNLRIFREEILQNGPEESEEKWKDSHLTQGLPTLELFVEKATEINGMPNATGLEQCLQ